MRVFGLTGGIGSGKSQVAAVLRARGLPVIDADELSRAAVATGSSGLQQIAERFGSTVLTASGTLDRARLGDRVFSDEEARRALNAIVHPQVRRLAEERFQELAAEGHPLACYEVPLLFEVGLESIYRPVMVVFAPLSTRKWRLAARDGLSDAQIDARIAAQLPLEDKVARADYLIDNAGSLAELAARSNAAFDELCRTLGVPLDRYAPASSADQRA